ncbi:MAG: hypothetical protein K6F88_00275 [Ruminococcus sp.]|nr:hypothetical protein [Ruminococcus sp.]
MANASKYDTHVKPYLDDIAEMYETMSEGDIARALNIDPNTLTKYKKKHKELANCFTLSRKKLIGELKATLKRKAKGFHYTEKKTITRTVDGVEVKTVEEYEKYAQPDTGAIHLLLKNLDDNWRNEDKQTMDLKKEKLDLERDKADNW